MSNGWFRTESDGHERTMVALCAAGVEVPKDLAAMDLRYFQNLVLTGRRERIPSRSQLMERWHWTDRRVRDLLADEARWSDPSKASEWQDHKGPADVQKRSSGGPAEVQVGHVGTVTMDERGPDEVQPTSNKGPAEVHTRVVEQEQEQQQEQEQGEEEQHEPRLPHLTLVVQSEPEVDWYAYAATYWGETVNKAIGRKPSSGPSKSGKLGQKLAVALRNDREQVLDAFQYVASSQIERARNLRAWKGLTLETALRHAETYAELWRAHGDEPDRAATGPPARAAPAKRYSTLDDPNFLALISGDDS